MLILLYGPDDYRRDEKRRSIVQEFRAKHGMAPVTTIDLLEEGAEGRMREQSEARSLFDTSKLIVLENAYELGKKQITDLIATHKDDKTIVHIIAEKTKPPKQFDALLKAADKKAVIVQEFEHLEGTAWKKFIMAAAKEREITLDAEAAEFMGTFYAKNTWGLMTELDKLALLGKPTITLTDIEGSNTPDAPNFFGMLGAFRSARVSDRLTMLETLFARGEPAAKLFFILAYQGDNALRFAPYDLAVKSGKLEFEEALLGALL